MCSSECVAISYGFTIILVLRGLTRDVRYISIQPYAIGLAIEFPESLCPYAIVPNRVSLLFVFFMLDGARFKLDSTSFAVR